MNSPDYKRFTKENFQKQVVEDIQIYDAEVADTVITDIIDLEKLEINEDVSNTFLWDENKMLLKMELKPVDSASGATSN